MQLFDLKSAILAKHAQHVVLVHFPIALFITGVALDFIVQWTGRATLAAASYYNLLMAAVSSVPAVATGLLAWRWQLDGQPLRGILLAHLVLALVSSVLIWIVWWMHFRARRRPARRFSVYRLPVELLAVLAVTSTAHLGGFLSGVNSSI